MNARFFHAFGTFTVSTLYALCSDIHSLPTRTLLIEVWLLLRVSLDAECADDRALDHQHRKPIAAVDQSQHRLCAAEGMVDAHRGDDEAEPDEEAADHAAAHRDVADMPHQPREHQRHDEQGDKSGGEEKNLRATLRPVGLGLADSARPRLRQNHVPDHSEAKAGQRGDDDGEIVHAYERHGFPSLVQSLVPDFTSRGAPSALSARGVLDPAHGADFLP